MNNSSSLRLLSFGIGLVAVIALTGMNVYSLYQLRESTIESEKENKRNYIEEFTHQVRHRFQEPSHSLRKFDMDYVEKKFLSEGDFPYKFKKALRKASEDSIFTDIYFSHEMVNHCQDTTQPIYIYKSESNSLERVDQVPEQVCDGIGLARSRMKVLIDDYRWNIKDTFDTHRSMTLSMINMEDKSVVGHLNFLIDREYLVNGFLGPALKKKFGPSEDTGIVIWLRNWMLDDVLASSDEAIEFKRERIQRDLRQRFPDMLDNWALYGQFLESPAMAASNASLIRNLIVLGTAVLALFGALIFMYITAKRERELAQRQAGFLANVTHELKTPLATMQAAGENIFDGRVTDGERLKTYGNHIYNETIRLRKMIDKLLDVARFDSGQPMVQQSPQNLEELIYEYYQKHHTYVTSKGFQFEFKTEENLPMVMADPDHLETIASNLVENALKYSPDKKEITLELRSGDKNVELRVHDKGVGIPKKSHKQIFDKFYRLEDSMTARTKGHGLGLSIVKNLVELNGGEITVQSKPGEGSTFIVSFPVWIGDAQEYKEQTDSYFDAQKQADLSEYVQ
ncbi:MAG: HAMP domain-containing sensor histidine kinase [Balneolaceae bacterium]